MRGSLPHRLAAWLALAAAFFTGVTPSEGLILCFEPDGTVALESSVVSRACGGYEEPATGYEAAARSVSASECCACLDIPVDGAGDEARAPLSTVELRIDLPSAPAAEFSLAPPAPPFEGVGDLCRGPPRPPGILAHIRSVVLRV